MPDIANTEDVNENLEDFPTVYSDDGDESKEDVQQVKSFFDSLMV